jgi:hypothetical protein
LIGKGSFLKPCCLFKGNATFIQRYSFEKKTILRKDAQKRANLEELAFDEKATIYMENFGKIKSVSSWSTAKLQHSSGQELFFFKSMDEIFVGDILQKRESFFHGLCKNYPN